MTTESYAIESHFAPSYASNIQMLLQQRQSRLLPCVNVGYHSGESASVVDQIGTINMQPMDARGTPMEVQEPEHTRRWVNPFPYDAAQRCYDYDKLRTVTDPTSSYVMAGAAAAQRQIDATISGAILGTNKTGKTGSTDTVFPVSGNTVGVSVGGATSGMNVTKLIEAIKMFMANEALSMLEMGDQVCCAVTAKQWADMFGDYRLTATEYRATKPIESADIGTPLGVQFVHYENLGVDSSGYRRCPIWVKSGMHFGWFQEVQANITRETHLRDQPWQIYQKMVCDATRLEEGKVLEILCDET